MAGQQRIEYEGKFYEFPDDATDDEIAAALELESNPKMRPMSGDRNLGFAADGGARWGPNERKMLPGLMSFAPGGSLVKGGLAAGTSLARSAMDGENVGDALLTAGKEGVLGAGAGIAEGLKFIAEPAKKMAGGLWRIASGAGTPQTAQAILSTGRGTLRPGNLRAIENMTRTGAVRPTEAFRNEVVGDMAEGVAHAKSRRLSALPTSLSAVAGMATHPVMMSGLAQGGYNAAKSFPKVGSTVANLMRGGELSRQAMMELLAQEEAARAQGR